MNQYRSLTEPGRATPPPSEMDGGARWTAEVAGAQSTYIVFSENARTRFRSSVRQFSVASRLVERQTAVPKVPPPAIAPPPLVDAPSPGRPTYNVDRSAAVYKQATTRYALDITALIRTTRWRMQAASL